MAKANKLKSMKQHYTNELHIYCRLLDWGLSKRSAKKYAILIHKLIPKNKKEKQK